MKCKNCGNETFIAQQIRTLDVLVDGEGNFMQALFTADAEPPTGPYICAKCGAEYDTLKEKEKKSEKHF